VARHVTARKPHGSGDLVGDRSLIKGERPLADDRIERRRKIGLHETVARLRHRSVRLQKNFLGRTVARELQLRAGNRRRQSLVHLEPFARKRDRGRDQLSERKFARAIAAMRIGEPRNRAGHTHRKSAETRALRIGLAFFVQKHIRGCGSGRGLAIVDRDGAVAFGKLDHHEAAAAQIAGFRQCHREGKTDGDGGVHRIAALTKNLHADPRSTRLLADDHAVLGMHVAVGGAGWAAAGAYEIRRTKTNVRLVRRKFSIVGPDFFRQSAREPMRLFRTGRPGSIMVIQFTRIFNEFKSALRSSGQ
jgi:hypothetical protein